MISCGLPRSPYADTESFLNAMANCSTPDDVSAFLHADYYGFTEGLPDRRKANEIYEYSESVLSEIGFANLPYRAYLSDQDSIKESTGIKTDWYVFAGYLDDIFVNSAEAKAPWSIYALKQGDVVFFEGIHYINIHIRTDNSVDKVYNSAVTNLSQGNLLPNDEINQLAETALNFAEKYAKRLPKELVPLVSEHMYYGRFYEPLAWLWFDNGSNGLIPVGYYFLIGVQSKNIYAFDSFFDKRNLL